MYVSDCTSKILIVLLDINWLVIVVVVHCALKAFGSKEFYNTDFTSVICNVMYSQCSNILNINNCSFAG